ncbi:unnamed protein product [Coffea canephora]|uniref:E2 ubiquitin-conjugating enzyme n=1 Tax=Coffea canephora TaxID=49390 RepID=A0A068U584_COFCA|nr:unnamed protein product [Coffea canephora]
MAQVQAARLNLRMQKELKLLLTDPPPGASFPSLSSSSAPSLTSIDAQIEGPEGTVYAKGVFRLKIQIPDRYPFQPPMVTFATPIYHPNIDNGGRICLDILNLPPKGAWQPSLNISTVLTSIGLLLSEPNPDDGLMHEASQEYKYNRQAFDQKARSLTEKYARIGESEIAGRGQGSQAVLKPGIQLVINEGMDTSVKEKRVDEYEVGHKRLCGISRKLSLESSELDQRSNEGKGVNQAPSSHLHEKLLELKGLKKDSMITSNDHNQTHQEPPRTRKKLSLEPSVVKHDNHVIHVVSNECSATSECRSLITSSPKSGPLEQPDLYSQNKNKDGDGISKSNSTETKLEKKPILESLDSNQGTGDADEKLLSVPQQSDIQFHSRELHKNFALAQTIKHDGREQHGRIVNGDANDFTRIKQRKLGLAGRKSALWKLSSYQGQQKDNIENLDPNSSFHIAWESKNRTISSSSSEASETGHCNERGIENHTTYLPNKLSRTVQGQPLKPLGDWSININNQFEMQSLRPSKTPSEQPESCYDEKQQLERPKQDCRAMFFGEMNKQEETSPSCNTYSVIVLDSEDSDEEQGRVARSRLSIARRLFLGKSKP